jgi:hypothetical protein
MASPKNEKDALNESQDLSLFVQGMLDEMVRKEIYLSSGKEVSFGYQLHQGLTLLSFVFPFQNSQFTEVEDNIMGRMGAMGKRMDNLERSELDLLGFWIVPD